MSALAAFLLQALAAGLILSVAALLADQGSRLLRRATRWIWTLAMLLTAALPVIPAIVPTGAAGPDGASAHSIIPWFDATVDVAGAARTRVMHVLASPAVAAIGDPRLPQSADGGTWLAAPAAWLCASLLAAAWLWHGHRQLQRRRRHWREALVTGVRVLLADDAGPAVAGVLRPRIVLPTPMLSMAPTRLATVLAHEQSHIDAGDPRLLAAMAMLLVLMPWQPFLWFQVARLRRAIEVDCDARVLAAGHRLADYGGALVDCASHRGSSAGFPAMAAAGGFLEQRLRLMMRRPARWQRWLAPLMLMLAGDVCVAAVAVSRAAPSMVEQGQAQAPASERVALAGYYQVGHQRVAVVGVTAKGLSMKINMERQGDLLPSSADDYFIPATDISVHFDRSAHTLRVRQHGVDADAAPRVDSAAVEAADAWIAQRVASQQPFPGAAAIIARNLGATRFEQLHSADFTPEFLRLAEDLMPLQQKRAASYGPLQEVTFDGVNPQGWDRYKVRYANRTVHWAIWVDGQGRLAATFADDMK